ncbi:MAG TPA: NADH-quinone oxidoreductase subunit M, partial [Bacteroidia bacterium]|nr:NADH-quinone oxidoreductase subunit M [Bacteroidia bacterium]
MNLSLLILVPLLTAIVILTCKNMLSVRWVAFIGSIVQLGLAGVLLLQYNTTRAAGDTAQMLFESRMSWYSALNIEYYIGVDGISIAMILLTAFVVAAGVLISWKMEMLTKEFFFMLML